MINSMRHGVLRSAVAVLAVLVLAGCTPDKAVKNTESLPTQAAGEACGFVSQQSAEIALGQSGLSGNGLKQDFPGTAKNPDGSKLNLAGCEFFAKDDHRLDVSVKLIGIPPYEERAVPSLLEAGGAEFVFPAAEGKGVAVAGGPGEAAATAQLIRGDWYYLVYLSKPTKGRKAVDDVVAILRQVVNQLDLPSIETLPRPTPTPTS
jgi:hypothetical protein